MDCNGHGCNHDNVGSSSSVNIEREESITGDTPHTYGRFSTPSRGAEVKPYAQAPCGRETGDREQLGAAAEAAEGAACDLEAGCEPEVCADATLLRLEEKNAATACPSS